MKCSRLISRGVAFVPWAALLAAALGCQPDAPGGAQQLAVADSAPQAVGDDFTQTPVEPNAADDGAPTADEAAPLGADEDRDADATETEADLAAGAAPFAAEQLTPQQHYDAGLSKEQAGNTGEAIAHYTAALELDPGFDPARKQLGALLLSLDRFVDAALLYGQLVEHDPDNADARNDWGVVLIRTGNLREAIDQFREALRLKPDHPDAHYNLAVALLTDGKMAEAIEHLTEALRIHPSYTDAHFMLGRAHLQQGRLDAALTQFQHVMRLDREYHGLDYELGRTFIRRDDVKKAVQHFSEAVRHNPLHFEARYALGMALVRYGNQAAALAQLTESVRLEPESPDAHLQLAMVLTQLGRAEEAIVHNDAALALRPDWPEALNNQAWLLATTDDDRLRDPQRALELAERAKALSDYKMPMVLDTLAAAQAAAGQFDEAQQTAEQAVQWAADAEQSQMAQEIRQRLTEYRAGRPFREPGAVEQAGDE